MRVRCQGRRAAGCAPRPSPPPAGRLWASRSTVWVVSASRRPLTRSSPMGGAAGIFHRIAAGAGHPPGQRPGHGEGLVLDIAPGKNRLTFLRLLFFVAFLRLGFFLQGRIDGAHRNDGIHHFRIQIPQKAGHRMPGQQLGFFQPVHKNIQIGAQPHPEIRLNGVQHLLARPSATATMALGRMVEMVVILCRSGCSRSREASS